MDVDVHQTECYGITFLGTKNVVIANNKIGGFTLNGLASIPARWRVLVARAIQL